MIGRSAPGTLQAECSLELFVLGLLGLPLTAKQSTDHLSIVWLQLVMQGLTGHS